MRSRASAGSAASTQPRPRAKKGHPEDDLQAEMVRWHARWVRPSDALLYACPNGERRDPLTAARLTGMSASMREALPDELRLVPAGLGVLPGVADLHLLLGSARLVLIEVKIPKIVWPPEGQGLPLFSNIKRVIKHEAGRQSLPQKRFQAGAEALGHCYRIIRTLDGYRALLSELGVPLRPTPALL